jgi:hypothetical protein
MSHAAKPPTCPNCQKPMTLARVAPKVGALPEMETFKCGDCAEVLTRIEGEE